MPKTPVRRAKTYNVDIAEEFKELHRQNAGLREDMNKQSAEMHEGLNKLNESFKTEIQLLKDSINVQTGAFERELTKLNDNMSRVLNQIADHEARLATLEEKAKAADVEAGVWAKVKRISLHALVWFFWAGVVVSAAYGVKPALKVFNLMAN